MNCYDSTFFSLKVKQRLSENFSSRVYYLVFVIILILSLTAKVIYDLDVLNKDCSNCSEVKKKNSGNFSIPREVS
jgi:hypothetical protein